MPIKLVKIDEKKDLPRWSPSKRTIWFDSPASFAHEVAHIDLKGIEFPNYEEESAMHLYAAAKGQAYKPVFLAVSLEWAEDAGLEPRVYAKGLLEKLRDLGYLSRAKVTRGTKVVDQVIKRYRKRFKGSEDWPLEEV